ncbi:hypothetical protein ABZ567_26630 [Streptomyces sp. NPDC016459]|uniref:hypothetical protein n=1 Tax=Streptomyces sp. NPDC016459 TaxID=3157190 RepID=UPI0033E92D56
MPVERAGRDKDMPYTEKGGAAVRVPAPASADEAGGADAVSPRRRAEVLDETGATAGGRRAEVLDETGGAAGRRRFSGSATGDEREMLVGCLADQRATLVLKCAAWRGRGRRSWAGGRSSRPPCRCSA